MPVIDSIIAKILILVDAFLEPFVTVTPVSGIGPCGITAITANLTPCGQAVLDNWLQYFLFDYVGGVSWMLWLGRVY